mmetsp:Transcript_13820/g.32906  ORF Transcript_13820/g.32906 Transcript_13820/m.32906 type:complete len:281 (+) Transcript_13820:810-1652(+)
MFPLPSPRMLRFLLRTWKRIDQKKTPKEWPRSQQRRHRMSLSPPWIKPPLNKPTTRFTSNSHPKRLTRRPRSCLMTSIPLQHQRRRLRAGRRKSGHPCPLASGRGKQSGGVSARRARRCLKRSTEWPLPQELTSLARVLIMARRVLLTAMPIHEVTCTKTTVRIGGDRTLTKEQRMMAGWWMVAIVLSILSGPLPILTGPFLALSKRSTSWTRKRWKPSNRRGAAQTSQLSRFKWNCRNRHPSPRHPSHALRCLQRAAKKTRTKRMTSQLFSKELSPWSS